MIEIIPDKLTRKEFITIIRSQEEIIQKQDKQISDLIDNQYKYGNKLMGRELDMILHLVGKKIVNVE